MGNRLRLITFKGNGARGRAFIGIDVRAMVERTIELGTTPMGAHGFPIHLEEIMRTTFTIELKLDVEDEEMMSLMHEILKTAAQGLFAQTVLLAGKRPPQIALKSENSFTGQADIELHNPTSE